MILEAFFILRIAYAVITLGIVVGVIIWAAKNDQFKDQDKTARLPLDIDE